MYLEESIKGSIFESLLQQYVPMLKGFWSRGLFEPAERRYYALRLSGPP